MDITDSEKEFVYKCNMDSRNVPIPKWINTPGSIFFYRKHCEAENKPLVFEDFINWFYGYENNRKEKEMNIYVMAIVKRRDIDNVNRVTDEIVVAPKFLIGSDRTATTDQFMLDHVKEINDAGGRKKVCILTSILN